MIARALICAALFASSTAFAQAPDKDQIAKARALNKKAEDLFAIAEYDRAIAAYKEAYELAPAPGLLFNIAQAYRLKGPDGCKNAVRFYRNYLLAEPDGPNRTAVDKHLAELEPCPDAPIVALPVHEPSPVVPPPVVAQAPPSRMPYVVIGGGGALLVGGVVMYVVADRKYASLSEGECASRDCPESTWSSYRWTERIGVGLMVAGTATAIGGAVWLLTRSTPQDSAPRVAGWASPQSGGVSFTGRF